MPAALLRALVRPMPLLPPPTPSGRAEPVLEWAPPPQLWDSQLPLALSRGGAGLQGRGCSHHGVGRGGGTLMSGSSTPPPPLPPDAPLLRTRIRGARQVCVRLDAYSPSVMSRQGLAPGSPQSSRSPEDNTPRSGQQRLLRRTPVWTTTSPFPKSQTRTCTRTFAYPCTHTSISATPPHPHTLGTSAQCTCILAQRTCTPLHTFAPLPQEEM